MEGNNQMTTINTTTTEIFSEYATAELGNWVSISAPKNGRGNGYVTSDDSYAILYNVNCSVITEEETESNIDEDSYFMRDRTFYESYLVPNYENKTDICPTAVLGKDGDTIVIWYSELSRKWFKMDDEDAVVYLNEIGIRL